VQIATDLGGIPLHAAEHPLQRVPQLTLAGKIPIVGSGDPGVMPQSLRRIEGRGIRGELMDFEPSPVGFEPRPHGVVLVIGRIVLNQVCALGIIPSGELLQVIQVGLRIQDIGAVVVEAGRIEVHRAKHLDALSLAGHGDLGLAAEACPGLIQGGVLPEGGFVLENQGRPFRNGFFFRVG